MKFSAKHFALLLIACALPFLSMAQATVGNVQSNLKRNLNTYLFSGEQADVQLEFCTPEMVRIRTSWTRSFQEDEPYMVSKYNWAPVNVETKEESAHYLLSTDQLDIKITKSPFSIEIANKEGDILSSEGLSEDAGSYKDEQRVGSRKKLMPDEHFFP